MSIFAEHEEGVEEGEVCKAPNIEESTTTYCILLWYLS